MAIVELDESGPLLHTVFDDVLRPAFRADELVTIDGLRHGILAGDTSVFATMDDHGAPAAVAVAEWSKQTGVALLAYLAVRPGIRSAGLGAGLLRHAVRAWRERWQPCLTLAEIEHPAAHAATEAYGDPTARLRFYARYGVTALDLPYFQPALGPGYHRIYGMLLCVVGIAPQCRGAEPDTADGDRLRRYLAEYLAATEGGIGSDPATQALFAAVDRPGGVPMLPLDDPSVLPCSTPLTDRDD